MIRVALDAMGGDRAPEVELEGVARALETLPEHVVIQLVGQPDAIEAELAKHSNIDTSRVEIHEATEVIGMAEKPLAAIRKKPNSSIVLGLTMQKQGKSDAFVSAGNTGAILAASTLLLRLHQGVERATVATPFPTADLPVLVLDGGANVDCSPRELQSFAYLGTVYMRDILNIARPVVGLLNIGEEDEKGNMVSKEANRLLHESSGLNYIGNIEGRDIIAGHSKFGRVDVAVCDGFVGNIVLKFYESVARLVLQLVKSKAPDILRRDDVKEVFRALDYSETGGAPLLGIKGVSIICHGSSSARAIQVALGVAVQAVETGLSDHIAAEFENREAVSQA
ncbi:MAG: phosphate acyltransferase PlsX [Gemmatimonadales bacterium]